MISFKEYIKEFAPLAAVADAAVTIGKGIVSGAETAAKTVATGVANTAGKVATSVTKKIEGDSDDETVTEHIVKVGSKFRLVSKKSGKNLGTYDSKAGAVQREREVEYFKHLNK
jgi:hypothetical protein